ncbi:hypothetical protein Avbf_00589 [Armadillidium vulgare]|nr:hypothetical protein Avbf_00589 [Armadillidium vulgare]
MHLVERHNYLKKFAMALNKESRNDLCTIRCKNLYKLEDIESVVKPPLVDWRVMKGANGAARRVYREAEAYEDEPVRYTIPSGIMLLKITQVLLIAREHFGGGIKAFKYCKWKVVTQISYI